MLKLVRIYVSQTIRRLVFCFLTHKVGYQLFCCYLPIYIFLYIFLMGYGLSPCWPCNWIYIPRAIGKPGCVRLCKIYFEQKLIMMSLVKRCVARGVHVSSWRFGWLSSRLRRVRFPPSAKLLGAFPPQSTIIPHNPYLVNGIQEESHKKIPKGGDISGIGMFCQPFFFTTSLTALT